MVRYIMVCYKTVCYKRYVTKRYVTKRNFTKRYITEQYIINGYRIIMDLLGVEPNGANPGCGRSQWIELHHPMDWFGIKPNLT